MKREPNSNDFAQARSEFARMDKFGRWALMALGGICAAVVGLIIIVGGLMVFDLVVELAWQIVLGWFGV
jgi:hypothetical protein